MKEISSVLKIKSLSFSHDLSVFVLSSKDSFNSPVVRIFFCKPSQCKSSVPSTAQSYVGIYVPLKDTTGSFKETSQTFMLTSLRSLITFITVLVPQNVSLQCNKYLITVEI